METHCKKLLLFSGLNDPDSSKMDEENQTSNYAC